MYVCVYIYIIYVWYICIHVYSLCKRLRGPTHISSLTYVTTHEHARNPYTLSHMPYSHIHAYICPKSIYMHTHAVSASVDRSQHVRHHWHRREQELARPPARFFLFFGLCALVRAAPMKGFKCASVSGLEHMYGFRAYVCMYMAVGHVWERIWI